ncbi:MAG: type II toxin-antitoxin system VapC family toxin [Acidobacteria bacterium]|nr:type II toxin-antitoxin system VapC family toxin [Acidobacteriota bacterium]
MMAKVYLETSFVSYLVARRSRDLIVAARQQLTNDWWENQRGNHDLFISEMVLREARDGDPDEVVKRLKAMDGFAQLDLTGEVAQLADQLLTRKVLPLKAARDAVHIAAATVHQMDYLLTWNFKHIANAHIRRMVDRVFRQAGYEVPLIVSPEELEESQ